MLFEGYEMKRLAFDALRYKYEAQKKNALFIYKNYATNPVAVGEHPDLLEEMDKAVQMWETANSRLEALNVLDSES
jgi:hypothetical protein